MRDFGARDAQIAEHEGGDSAHKSLGEKMVGFGNYMVDLVEEQGTHILREEYCVPFTGGVAIHQEPDEKDNFILNVYVYGMMKAESGIGETFPHGLESNTSCDKLDVFRSGAGMPMADVIGYGNFIMAVFNDVILILLLAVFILLERPEGSTFGMSSRAAIQTEAMCKHYIGLKTVLSAGTGLVVGLSLWVCGTKLSFVWGFLTFILNFVPQIGNLVSWLLPIPLIVLDDDMGWLQTFGAIMIPLLIQLWTVNFLEPELFGTALNMTPLSVLLSLVFFMYAWGIPGAVLSVPLLGVFKILMHNSVHPLSETVLRLIREDADIDIEKDLDLDEWLDRMEVEQRRIDEIFRIDLEGSDGQALSGTDHRAEEHLVGFRSELASEETRSHDDTKQLRRVHARGHATHKLHHTNTHAESRAHKSVVHIQKLQRGREARREYMATHGFHAKALPRDALYNFLASVGLQQFHRVLVTELDCQNQAQLQLMAPAELAKIGMADADIVKVLPDASGASKAFETDF